MPRICLLPSGMQPFDKPCHPAPAGPPSHGVSSAIEHFFRHLKLLHLQALICTALDLPPTYFRRLLQSNAATTVLDFQPMPDDPSVTQVIVDRLNQVRTGFCQNLMSKRPGAHKLAKSGLAVYSLSYVGT